MTITGSILKALAIIALGLALALAGGADVESASAAKVRACVPTAPTCATATRIMRPRGQTALRVRVRAGRLGTYTRTLYPVPRRGRVRILRLWEDGSIVLRVGSWGVTLTPPW